MPEQPQSSLAAFAESYKSLMGGTPPLEQGEVPTPEKESQDPQEAPQEATAEQPKAEDEQSDDEAISSFDDLAASLGVDRDALEDLSITLKVNGNPVETKLRDALARFQIDEAAKDRLQDAKQQEAAVKARKEEMERDYGGRLQELGTLVGIARQTLGGSVEKELQELEKQREDLDSTEYYVRKAQIRERGEQVQALEQQYQQAWVEHMNKARDELRRTLPDHIPEWRDSSTREAELKRMDEYLLGQGFTSEQIGTVLDPKAINLVRKAMLYDDGKKAVKGVKAKSQIRLAGSKPPERRSSTVNRKQLEAKKDVLKKAGTVRAFADLYKEMRQGSK